MRLLQRANCDAGQGYHWSRHVPPRRPRRLGQPTACVFSSTRTSPGDLTTPHEHPDSVMYTRSAFRRRLYKADNEQREVEIEAGLTGWLPAQQHSGHNIGDTDTHVIFVELKDGVAASPPGALGPN